MHVSNIRCKKLIDTKFRPANLYVQFTLLGSDLTHLMLVTCSSFNKL